MRGATQCARRLKQLIRSLRTKLGKATRPSSGDAITQMILGIFSRDVPETKAREALDRLRAQVVDYNELRVVPPIEMTEMVGELPEARLKCEDLSRALNKVFTHEHTVALDRLGGLSKKEVFDYLESVDGLDAYSRARVRLLGLRQHAIPLDAAMWAYARKCAIIDQRCSLKEAQAFLERQIPEDEALEFVALLEKQAWAEMGAAVRNCEVEPITSVPPDRTARNMLQLVASGRAAGAAVPPTRRGETDKAPTSRAPARTDGDGQSTRRRQRPVASALRGRRSQERKQPVPGARQSKISAGSASDRSLTRQSAARSEASAAATPDPKKSARVKIKSKAKSTTGVRRKTERVGTGQSKAKENARTKATQQARASSPKVKSA